MEKESEELKQAVKVCPTVEELRWKPPTNATRFICPVKDCRAFAFKSQGGLTQHINTLHPQLSACASGDQVHIIQHDMGHRESDTAYQYPSSPAECMHYW